MPMTSLKPKYLQCRTFGHAWKPSFVRYTAGQKKGTVLEYRAVLVCRDCKTEREQVFSPTGEITKNRYRYPQQYLKPADEDDGWTKADARLAFVHIMTIEEETDGQPTDRNAS